jgi:hypothetical protein
MTKRPSGQLAADEGEAATFELPPAPDVVHHHFRFPAESGPVVAEKLDYRIHGWRVSEIVITEHRYGAVKVKVLGNRLTKKGLVDRRCYETIVQNQEFTAAVASSWAARTVTSHLVGGP